MVVHVYYHKYIANEKTPTLDLILHVNNKWDYFLNLSSAKPQAEDIEEKHYDHSDDVVYSMVKVLWKETAFPRCKATDSRWKQETYLCCVLSDGWYCSVQLLY